MSVHELEGLTLGRLLTDSERPPDGVEWMEADDIGIFQMLIRQRGHVIFQHDHDSDHVSMVATGGVRVWRDGKLGEVIMAPKPIFIAAGVAHTFQALEDNTLIYCIHNMHGKSAAELRAGHESVG